MMTRTLTFLTALLVALLLMCTPTDSQGFGVGKRNHGHRGGTSGVAEILAAGLITGMLMDQKPKSIPVIRHVMSHVITGYGPMHGRHPMRPMIAARMPMMNPYLYPIMPPQHQRYSNMMNHALMSEVSKHEALASRLHEEIRALEEQESILEAALERARHGSETAINELLSEAEGESNIEDDETAAATLLLETAELMAPAGLQHPHPMPPPEMFHAAPSEPESRYLLPRIVRHFVQRLMRRAEHH